MKCKGDCYCCKTLHDENKYPFLNEFGYMFFIWQIGAGAIIIFRYIHLYSYIFYIIISIISILKGIINFMMFIIQANTYSILCYIWFRNIHKSFNGINFSNHKSFFTSNFWIFI